MPELDLSALGIAVHDQRTGGMQVVSESDLKPFQRDGAGVNHDRENIGETLGLADDTVERAMLIVEDNAEVRKAMLGILASEAPRHWKVVAPDRFEDVEKLLYAAEYLRRKVGVVFVDAGYKNPDFVGLESRHPFDVRRFRGWQVATASRLAFPDAGIVGPRSALLAQGAITNDTFELHKGLTRVDEHGMAAAQTLKAIGERHMRGEEN